MFDWFFTLLQPLEYAVATIMVGLAHRADRDRDAEPTPGGRGSLSIVGLVIVIRILLIPLFVRQIRASRAMQLIQPEIKKIQDKYKGKSDPASRRR
jgi:YidC/Oxa1 family membrane protein insertase